MKKFLLKTILLLFALVLGTGVSWATEVTYKLTIDANDFNTTSYVANNNEKTSYAVCTTDAQKTFEVKWTSNQVMKNGSNMQWQKSKGYIYNSTDLGTITGVTVTSSAGSFTTYYGDEEQPSSGTSGAGKGYFKTSVGSATGTTSKVEITFTVSEGGESNLEDNDLALTGNPVELEFDLYNNASQVIYYTTSSTGAVTIADSEYASFAIDQVNKKITVTPTAVTPSTQTITVNQAADETYDVGSTTFTLTITDSTPKTGAWELTDIADITAEDVFVIVGDNTFALPNDNGTSSAPSAVAVTIENDEITSDVTDNIKWNISGDAENGYTFYPNGDAENWLYCNTTAGSSSNNNMRVGTGDRKIFALSEDNLITNDNYTDRYLSIYNNSDWRGYTNANLAPSISFYKYVNNAAVKNPVITVENTFIGSTTATITCSTEGAAIKYSYDGETWNDYSEALTITATTTIYAKAVKSEDESEVVSKTTTKVLPTPTVTISGAGITNTNVYTGTAAGSLAATVTYNEAAVEGAVVTWSGNKDEVATINAETGAVTLVAAGSVTFTATYAGNSDYAEKTATYEMTIINVDPNAPGTENNPYTVAQAIAATPASGTSANVYIRGIVSAFYGSDIIDDYSHRYYISDDGTTTGQLLVYNGKGLNNVAFSTAEDLQLGDVVVILGGLTTYNSTKEVAKDNYIVSLVRKVATPTFDPAAGEVIAGSTVTISTTTEDATIYYTTNGDEPTTESTLYTGPITIDAAQTIKAIAVKDGMTNSDVASASYTIIVTPTIAISTNLIEATAAGADDIVALAYSNLTINDKSDFAVQYCDNLGEETDAPNWMEAEVLTEDGENYSVLYTIGENTSTEPRTAYFKVYAMDDKTNLVYSDLVTVTQAGIDYATLPFEYDGNATGTLPTGLAASGTGTYASSPKIKFDGTGDYVTLKIDEAPGVLTFDIKGNSFSGGTFKLQASADGSEYADVATYTELGTTETVTIDNLASSVRYIKWVYTEKVSGNVALGNINFTANAGSITLAAACTDGEGIYYGTYSSSEAFIAPAGVTVAEIGIENGKLNVEEYSVGAVVPANTGVMVSSTVAGLHNLSATELAGTSVLGEDNRLRASGAGITAEAMAAADSECLFYRLTMHNGTDIGFWWGAAEGAAFNLAANKAYLAVSNAVSVKGFSLFSDDETGITEVAEKTEGTEKVFDLSGRRVVKPTKGLYIVNGKKYIKK